jgi:hypothetical protein
MWKCFGINGLGEKASWVRFAKRGKKQGINGEKRAGKGEFLGRNEDS